MMSSSDETKATWAKRSRRVVFYILGAGLLAGSVWMALTRGDFSKLADAPPHLVGFLLAAICCNVLLTGLLFSFVTRPFEDPGNRVSLFDMEALVASSTLLNYLPLQAGLIGRAAYLKRQHGILYRSSLVILGLAYGMSLVIYVVFFGVTWLLGNTPHTWTTTLLVLTVLPPLFLPLTGKPVGGKGTEAEGEAGENARIWSRLSGVLGQAWAVRCVDVMVTSIRYTLVFGMLGVNLRFPDAVLLATCGSFVTLIGPTPNGLGVREWLLSLLTASGVVMAGSDMRTGLSMGLTFAVVDRAAEAVVVIVLGLGSTWYLKRKISRAKAGSGFDAIHEEEGDGEVDEDAKPGDGGGRE